MSPSNVSVNLTFQVRPFAVTLMALSIVARAISEYLEAAACRRVVIKSDACLHPDAAGLPPAQTLAGQAGPDLGQPCPPGEAR